MKWLKSITVLVLLVLTIVAIVLSQMEFPSYSTEEISEEVTDLYWGYSRLREQHATEAQWRAFAEEARQRTEPIIADMDKHSSLCKAGNRPLYQMAKHALPHAIASRGRTPPTDIEQWLRQSHDELRPMPAAKQTTAQRQETKP